MARITYFIILMPLLQCIAAYKILVVFTLPSKSHNILGRAYVKYLLEAGHEVTYMTPFATNKTTDKYHEVDLSKNMAIYEGKEGDIYNLKRIIDKTHEMNVLNMLPEVIKMLKKSLQNENLMKFLGDTTQHFDAVVVEWSFGEVHSGFAAVFDCPLIWFDSNEPHWMVLKLVHERSNPAYNADVLSSKAPPYSFVERLQSLMAQIIFTAITYFYLGPAEIVLFKEYFEPFLAMRGRALPEYQDVAYNGSFLLTNSHPALGQPVSVPPNTKEISGFHIDPNTQPLSVDLQKIMNEAEHGVIFFSMGSTAKSTDFPESIKQEFLKVFGGLKQTVLWKFEEQFPNLPKNVHILHWAPQQSILAHPNLRIFITHGGLLSTTEAIYFGVPMIVMPFGLDQHLNADRTVKKGFGLKVDLSYEMAGETKIAIEEILSNHKYHETAKELSRIYHDRAVPPGKELVHWVEHVIKTRGAPHLRSPALLLPWYQKMYLDLLLLVVVALYVVKLILKKLYCVGKSLLFKSPIANGASKKKTDKLKSN